MEFKYYDKSWLPAIKGAFLILFGIIAMSQVVGSIRNMASLFIVLIGMIGILLLSSGILMKKSRFRIWSIISGAVNLLFCLILAFRIEAPREEIGTIILFWIIFQAITEIAEAGMLFYLKNAFAALFLLNALLTFLFGYFLNVLMGNFTPQSVYYLGVIALVFGLANELSSYLLTRIKK
jgi:uncharacterized membrane protein HdeD (DUF308 family)